MGLDACVYCACFERGELLVPPKAEWEVRVSEDGSIFNAAGQETDAAFDVWQYACDTCEHDYRKAVSHRIGNIALVGHLRSLLELQASRFPLILEKVLYNGIHAGDWIGVDTVRSLQDEVNLLRKVQGKGKQSEEYLRNFEDQLRELTECAIALEKPISF